MPAPSKSGGPPSFYSSMAQMSPSSSSPSPSPSGGAAGAGVGGAGQNEKQELAVRFLNLAQKWGSTGKDEQKYADQIVQVVKQYMTDVLKKKPEDIASAGAGAGSSSAGANAGAGGAGAPGSDAGGASAAGGAPPASPVPA